MKPIRLIDQAQLIPSREEPRECQESIYAGFISKKQHMI